MVGDWLWVWKIYLGVRLWDYGCSDGVAIGLGFSWVSIVFVVGKC